ncbi:MAG TPA: hypothetical protein VG944_20170 [Fimbriimonas sp.]|nr:hypothetical protein [Fimbriimonas sp.]
MKSISKHERRFWVATLLATTAAFLYVHKGRPKHLKWGATCEEAKEYLQGDELIPGAAVCATHAVTIKASPKDVWPWLAQIGQTKGGFYSYALLENLAGCKMPNVRDVHPEWQSLKIGDEVRFHPDFPPAPIVMLKAGEHMVIGADLTGPNATSWAFVVRDLGHGLTRLIVRLRGRPHHGIARLSDLLVYEPAHFVMERKMLLTIKKLAEQTAARSEETAEAGMMSSRA